MSRCVALSGGVGGAKLALGLMRALEPDDLVVIVNTGDDFVHYGLHISPDLDTALYTLSGLANPETGWGRRDETWSFMSALAALGGETWFRLGDGDLALHAERTRRLSGGESLSQITRDLAGRLGIAAAVLPMTDDQVRTRVATDEGEFDFQDYFVRRQCRPHITALRYDGAAEATVTTAVADALQTSSLECIVICPSNPYLSIGPMLAMPNLHNLIAGAQVPVVAVSPLVGSQAVKGPTTKIMRELGIPVSPVEIVRLYGDLIDGFVLDERDATEVGAIDVPLLVTDTLMQSLHDRERVARSTLAFAKSLDKRRRAAR